MNLYNFNSLSEKLNELGYPAVTESRFEIVRKDLTEEFNKGNIEFKQDGIYLNINGVEHKGYMYIKGPNINRYGFPRFHITNCSVIQQQQEQGRFHNHYYWHNSNLVDLIDRANGQKHDNVSLSLCSRCREQAGIDNYNDTMSFFESLEINQRLDVNADLDIYGYVKNWRQISKMFRISKDYTCNRCTLKIENKYDQRFIQVHHIDGNKLNNQVNNLECLCPLCHANVDEHHQNNFSNRRNQKEIEHFLLKYKERLIELNNLYVG